MHTLLEGITMFTTDYKYDHAIVTDPAEPGVRYVVMHDDGASSPLEGVDPYITAHVVASGYGSVTESDDDLTRAYLRFAEYLDEYHAFDVFQRYLEIFHGWTGDQINERVELCEHTGYSQGDWATALVIVHDEGYGSARGWAEEWGQWARGDVFFVRAERFIACESSECHGGGDSHWTDMSDQGVEFEVLGGIFADDAEGAVKRYLQIA